MLEQINHLEEGVELETVLDRTKNVTRMQQAFTLIRSRNGDDPTFAECKAVLDYLRVAATLVKVTNEDQGIKQTRPRE